MIVPITHERVLCRRQGSPFLAFATGRVHLDIRKPGRPESETTPGACIGMELIDDRGMVLFAQMDQIEPATAAMEKEHKTDLTPRVFKREWSDPLNLGRVVMTQ